MMSPLENFRWVASVPPGVAANQSARFWDQNAVHNPISSAMANPDSVGHPPGARKNAGTLPLNASITSQPARISAYVSAGSRSFRRRCE